MRKLNIAMHRAAVLTLLGLSAGFAAAMTTSAAGPVGSAFADTQAYALYCPGTPVGNIGFTNVVTTGTISPASPASGSQFNLTNFQTKVNLAAAIVNATAALGNSAVMGTAVATVNATGATPSTMSSGTLSFNEPIPSPVPSTGVTLSLPASVSTIGPFTATGGAISLTLNDKAQLNVSVTPGSAPLALTCTAYTNNAVTAGLGTPAPSASPAAPVIATASAGAAAASTAATQPPTTTPTTAAPSTSASSSATPTSTAYTGAGPELWLLALLGIALVGLGLASFLVGAGGRGPLVQALRTAGPYRLSRTDLGRATAQVGRALRPKRVDRSAVGTTSLLASWKTTSADPADVPPGLWIDVGKSAAKPVKETQIGLWVEGWEPDSGN